MRRSHRHEWITAGYSSEMGSAAVAPPPNPGFQRLYHLTSADYAISDLALSRLKIARFSDLNDPFELLALNFRERQIRAAVIDFKNTTDAHTGILSFSEDWTNPVLWSHYAAKHRGICLGFDLPTGIAEQVLYQDERLAASVPIQGSPALDADTEQLLLHTKFKHWEYEREYRIFIKLSEATQEGKLHFFPFGPTLQPSEVILGTLCDLSVHAVRQLVSQRHPKAVVFKARLADKFFKVVPDEGTVMSPSPTRQHTE